MDVNRLDKRYLHDTEFYHVVQLIEGLLAQSELTPLDIRDACYLARYKFEKNNPRPISMPKFFGDYRDES